MYQYLILFFISMVPVIELRGAIPIGVITYGLPFISVYIVSVIGNMVPVPILIVFARKVLEWGATWPKFSGFFKKIISIGEGKIKKIPESALMIGLYLFVAIPAPGTGAWTGCLIATLLNMKVRKAIIPIFAGVMTSGIIMGIVSFGLGKIF